MVARTLAALALLVAPAGHATEPSPVTVANLLGLTRFAQGPYVWYEPDRFITSPDGKRTVVLTVQGDLERNTRIYRLLLLDNALLKAHPAPHVAAQFASSSNRPAIKGVRWLEDNATLAFLAENPGELPQVHTLDTRSGTATKRTQATGVIRQFGISASGETIVYAEEGKHPQSEFQRKRAQGFVLPENAHLGTILEGDYRSLTMRSIDPWEETIDEPLKGPLQIRVRHGDAPPHIVNLQDAGGACRSWSPSHLRLSPSGIVLLIPCNPNELPAFWREYGPEAVPLGPAHNWKRWMVLDLESGRARPLLDTPIAFQPNLGDTDPLLWSRAGKSIVLSDALLPGEDHRKQRYLVEAHLADGSFRIISTTESAYPPTRLEWHPSKSSPLIRISDTRGFRYFEQAAGEWHALRKPPAEALPVLKIDEGLNSPWKLTAVDPGTKRTHLVYDPNPGLLQKYRFARVTELHWRYDEGRKQGSATLYWPVNYRKGQRYPLVIQGHGKSLTNFWPEGQTYTREAAQPLANADIFVAQIGEGGPGWEQHNFDSYRHSLFAQIEGLIDHLDREMLIDRALVGLAGVSTEFGAFMHFMTHSDYPIAAAALAEGVEYSYLSYLGVGVGHSWPQWQQDFERLNGGIPWGPAQDPWRERAPGFRLDGVTAAVQLESSGENLAFSMLGMWEIYQGLRLLGKPVEFVMQPDAVHVRTRAWDCYVSQQGMVDWMRFWLQGFERLEPATTALETRESLAEKYSRWREMRTRAETRRGAVSLR